MADPKHEIRFPNESDAYRATRNVLLKAEADLRAQTEKVAALRRKLPLGGAIPEDYVFEDLADGRVRETKLTELFEEGKNSLIVYSFMFGPNDHQPCPMCASFLDSTNASAPHIEQRVSLAVVAKSPIARIHEFAAARGWSNLRMLSSAHNSYNADYHGEVPRGGQMPMCNVFVKTEGGIRHFYATELLFAGLEGQPRHVDPLWPLWNFFDLTPEGRGTDWYPALSYHPQTAAR